MIQAKNILVRGPNWVGDVVMATPGFRALRAAFPDARITLQLRPGLEPLLAGAPWFDEVQTLESYHRGAGAMLAEARKLREARFDLGICLPDSFSSALLMRLAGVPKLAGYDRGPRRLLLTEAIPAPSTDPNGRVMLARELHVMGLIEALGGKPQGTQLELFTTKAEEDEAERALGAQVEAAQPLVVFAPGAAYGPSKLWPMKYFAELGDALAEQRGAAIALVGSPNERAIAEEIASQMNAPIFNWIGEISFGAMKAVLRRASLMVCNDAGARHVAVAFGVPSLVIFGPTSIDKTNMNLERVQVFTQDVPCRPCYKRVCPIDHPCMLELKPERLIEAALPLLSDQRDAALRAIAAQRKGEA